MIPLDLDSMSIEEINQKRTTLMRQMGAIRSRAMGVTKGFENTFKNGGMPQIEDVHILSKLIQDWLDIRNQFASVTNYEKGRNI